MSERCHGQRLPDRCRDPFRSRKPVKNHNRGGCHNRKKNQKNASIKTAHQIDYSTPSISLPIIVPEITNPQQTAMIKQVYQIAICVAGLSAPAFAASIQSVDASSGFGIFNTSGGSGGSSGTFTGASDIGNPSWGFYANNGETSQALYDFAGGALTVGQTVSFQIDNGNIQPGGTVGI